MREMTMPDKLIDAIFNHWRTVVTAHVPFVAIGMLGLSAGWFARKAWDHRRLTLWQDLVANAPRSSGVEQLKTAVSLLQKTARRTITEDQKQRFASTAMRLAKPPPEIQIFTLDPDRECKGYAGWLGQLFRDNGLTASAGGTIFEYAPPTDRGLLLVVPYPDNLSAQARTIKTLLDEAGIKYEIAHNPRPNPHPDWVFLGVGRDR